nr:penicillin-binding protein 2 [Alphaproteobacteria bacterium]
MGVFAYLKECLDNIKFGFLENKKHVNLGRVYVVLVFFIFCYFVISLRLFDLTILKGITDDSEFTSGFSNKSSVNFDRGDILDRNGELLAVNLITTSIYANPRVIENPKDVAKRLYKIFPDLDYKDLLEKLESDKAFVWVKRNISPKKELVVNNEGIPGIYFRFGKRRAYPQGNLVSHVVGYVGLDGDGLMGAESYFDKFLKSRHENKKLQNLRLSIEIRAQSIVREELQKAVKEFRAKGAVGILQDITNGEIIAMVSLPDYDPNDISFATEHQLFNKATLGNYEVGSVFKIFTMAAALDSGIVKVNDVYDVNTPLKSGGFYIKDFYGKKGWLSVPQILMYSSNIGIAQIALEIGKEKQFEAIKSLGLLSETEVELSVWGTVNGHAL